MRIPFAQTGGIVSAWNELRAEGYAAMVSTFVPPRLGTPRNQFRETLGWMVRDVGRMMDFDLYEWQQYLSDVSMEYVPRARKTTPGQSDYRMNFQYVGAMVGRQSGKSAWCASRIVTQCLLPNYYDVLEEMGLDDMKPQHVVYTAQSRTNAVQRWLEHIDLITRAPQISAQIQTIRYATGREILIFENGSTYRPITPNRTGARGLTLDLAIVDEALAHPLWLLPVLRPTMAQRDSAAGTIGCQFVVISNAGDDDSELLNRMQELGIESLTDPDAKRCWFEWSMAEGADPYDENVWRATLPTLDVPNGIEIEFLREEAKTLREDQFIREYLCRRSVASSQQIIPSELWAELYRTDVMVPMDNVCLGLDVRRDRMGAAIVACGPQDLYLPIEIIESRSGLDWVLPRTIELARRWNAPVAIDVGGPGANLIPSLDNAGVTLELLQASEIAMAAATFYDNALAKRITHMNDYRLNDAIVGASRRAIGDRWAFDRRGEKDISPLVAASLAVWISEKGQLTKPTIW